MRVPDDDRRPVAPGSPGWKGEWVQLYEDGRWEFHRCVRCGRALKKPEHRESGLGAECAKIEPALAGTLREQARATDRQKLRRENWYRRRAERDKAAVEELIRSREQLEIEPSGPRSSS